MKISHSYTCNTQSLFSKCGVMPLRSGFCQAICKNCETVYATSEFRIAWKNLRRRTKKVTSNTRESPEKFRFLETSISAQSTPRENGPLKDHWTSEFNSGSVTNAKSKYSLRCCLSGYFYHKIVNIQLNCTITNTMRILYIYLPRRLPKGNTQPQTKNGKYCWRLGDISVLE